MNRTSPIPQETKVENTMDFYTSLKEVVAGKKITKKEWKNKNIYCVLKDDCLMLRKEDEKYYQWIINRGDLMGEDWIVI